MVSLSRNDYLMTIEGGILHSYGANGVLKQCWWWGYDAHRAAARLYLSTSESGGSE